MNESPNFYDERLDAILVLLAPLERMEGGTLREQPFPTPDNWQGLSLGRVVSVWLGFILAESDHRLSPGQPWVEPRFWSLQTWVSPSLRALDFSDDRLVGSLDSGRHGQPSKHS